MTGCDIMKQTGVYLQSFKRCQMLLSQLRENWQNRKRENRVYCGGFPDAVIRHAKENKHILMFLPKNVNTLTCCRTSLWWCQHESALLAEVVRGWGSGPRLSRPCYVSVCRSTVGYGAHITCWCNTEELTVQIKADWKTKKSQFRSQSLTYPFSHSIPHSLHCQ